MPLEQGLMLWFLYNHHLAASLQPGDLVLSFRELKAGGDALQERLAGFIRHHCSNVLSSRKAPQMVFAAVCATRSTQEAR